MDAVDRVLQLVAEGRLTAEEAAPLIDAIERGRSEGGRGASSRADSVPGGVGEASGPRYARIEVTDDGRRVVDLRIPISLGRFALTRVPGLSPSQIADVEEAVAAGARGPILDVMDESGDGVRITLE